MRYRKVTLMPPPGLVLERAAVLCGIVESGNHEREDILYIYFVIRFFFFIPDFPNRTCSSIPHPGMPRVCQTLSWHFVGAARESGFTSAHEELLHLGECRPHRRWGLIRLHRGEIASGSSEGRPPPTGVGKLHFSIMVKRAEKDVDRGRRNRSSMLMESCWW